MTPAQKMTMMKKRLDRGPQTDDVLAKVGKTLGGKDQMKVLAALRKITK